MPPPSKELQQLEARLRSRGLRLFEPSGQDAPLCQYLAVIRQLELHGVRASLFGGGAYALESTLIKWLGKHADDVVSIHGERGMQAELSLLRHSWTESDYGKLRSRTAWGDHYTLAAMTAMFKEHGVHARVEVFDSRGESYDKPIIAEAIYGVVPTMTLRLAFVGTAGSLVALRLATAPSCEALMRTELPLTASSLHPPASTLPPPCCRAPRRAGGRRRPDGSCPMEPLLHVPCTVPLPV